MIVPYKKIVHLLAKGIGGVLLLLLFFLLGLGFFIHTDYGLTVVLDLTKSLLEKQGFSLTYDSISGPLPSHLSIKGLSLKDKKGIWLAAKEVTVDLKPLALLSGTLDVNLVRLAGVEVARTPIVDSVPDDNKETTSSDFSLPLDINVEQVAIENVLVAEEVVAPRGSSEPAPEQSNTLSALNNTLPKQVENALSHEQNISLKDNKSIIAGYSFLTNLHGKAGISNNRVTFALKGTIALNNHEGLRVLLALDKGKNVRTLLERTANEAQDSPFAGRSSKLIHAQPSLSKVAESIPQDSSSWLAVLADGVIAPKGFMAKMLSMPEGAGGAIVFYGIGPIANWDASLGFSLMDSQQKFPLRGRGNVHLSLEDSHGIFLPSSDKKLLTKAKVLVLPGQGYTSLPKGLGKEFSLTATAKGTTSRFTTEMKAKTTLWEVSLHDLVVDRMDNTSSLSGQYSLFIPEVAALGESGLNDVNASTNEHKGDDVAASFNATSQDQQKTFTKSTQKIGQNNAFLERKMPSEKVTPSTLSQSNEPSVTPSDTVEAIAYTAAMEELLASQKQSLSYKNTDLDDQPSSSFDATSQTAAESKNNATVTVTMSQGGISPYQESSNALPLSLSGTFSLMSKDEGKITAETEGKVSTVWHGDTHALDYSFDGNMDTLQIQLKTLSLSGLGLSLQGTALIDRELQEQGGVNVDIRASGKEDALWQKIINTLLGTDKEQKKLEGSFSLAVSAKPEGEKTKGLVTLDTKNMHWPSEQMNGIFGTTPQGKISFLVGKNLPFEAHIQTLEMALLSAKGEAVLLPERDQVAAPKETERSVKEGIIATTEKQILDDHERSASLFSQSSVNASLTVFVTDLSRLSKDLKGKATLTASATGPLSGFTTKITARSDTLDIPTGTIKDALFAFTSLASLPLEQDSAFSLTGTAKMSASDTPGGPITMNALVNVGQGNPKSEVDLLEKQEVAKNEKKQHGENSIDSDGTKKINEPLVASLPELTFQGAGIHLSGKVIATLSDPPAVNGDIQATVSDWSKIADLTGQPLQGDKTLVTVKLFQQDTQQVVAADIDINSIAMKDSFTIAALKGKAEVRDLFATPKPSVSIHVGQGSAGPLDWEQGHITIASQNTGEGQKSRKGKGQSLANNALPIDILFTGKAIEQKIAQKGTETTNKKISSPFALTDRIALQGSLDLPASTLFLDSLAIYLPKSEVGVRLRKKATLRYAPDLSVDNFALQLTPGGSVTLNALFSPERTAINASIDTLPLEVIQAFAGANLPKGTINLSAKMKREQGQADGIFTMQAMLASSNPDTQINALSFAMSANVSGNPDNSFPGMQANTSHVLGKGTFSAQKNSRQNASMYAQGPNTSTLNTRQESSVAGVNSRGSTTQYGTIKFDIPLQFTTSGIPLPVTDKAFGVSLHFDGPVETLWQALALPDRDFSGKGKISADLFGSLDTPKGHVTASLKQGLYEDRVLGIRLQDISLEAKTEASQNNGLRIKASLFAADGKNKGNSKKDKKVGTIALEALIGQKFEIEHSSLVSHLSKRSGNESQKIVAQEKNRTKTNSTAEKNISLDWNGPTVASNIDQDNDKAPPSKIAAKAQKNVKKKRSRSKLNSHPIQKISDPRIADKDMCIAVRGQVHNLDPLQRDDISLLLSGLLGVEGLLTAPHITGDILVQRAEVLLEVLSLGSSVTTLPLSDSDSTEITSTNPVATADIHVGIPGRTFIRGFTLDSEWQGDLSLSGKVSSPQLSGSLHAIGGGIEMLSKPFDFSKGEIFFLGGVGSINPGLDLELVNRSSGLEAYIRVTGTSSSPKLELASIPSVPKDEIISQLLFNKESSSLSRFEALQLADTLNDFFGGGKTGIFSFSSLRKKLGVDVLRVNSGNEGAGRELSSSPGAGSIPDAPGGSSTEEDSENISLEAGKYILDNVYMGVQQDAKGGTGVKVDVELSPNVSIQGSSTQQSSQIGAGWKMDY